MKGRSEVKCQLGVKHVMDSLRLTRPLIWKLTLGAWNVTSLVRKEAELVCEMERCGLDTRYHTQFRLSIRGGRCHTLVPKCGLRLVWGHLTVPG